MTGFCEHGTEPLGFIKTRVSLLAGRVTYLGSQGALYSMKLVLISLQC